MRLRHLLRVAVDPVWRCLPSSVREAFGRSLGRGASVPHQEGGLTQQFRALTGQLPDTAGGQKILLWRGPGGVQYSLSIELVITSALALRGTDVTFVVCDGLLSGCMVRLCTDEQPIGDWSSRCERCCAMGTALIEAAGFRCRYAGEWVSAERRAELREMADSTDPRAVESQEFLDVPVGRYALSSALRYFKGKGPADDPLFDDVLREYFYSALVSTEAAKGALDELSPNRLFMQHGIYVDWGPLFDLAKRARLHVTRYMRGYLANHLYLKTTTPEDPRHLHYLSEDAWQELAREPLSEAQRETLDHYMTERRAGAKLRASLFDEAPMPPERVRESLGLPEDGPVWGLFPHVTWDSVFADHYMPFRDPTEWLLETIGVIVDVRDVTWVVRIHPGEKVDDTARGCEEIIADRFPSLPDHVRIVPADSSVNTYGLLPLLSGGVTIQGTVGMELALMGKPAILAAIAHYAGKGFTYESDSREGYFALLRSSASLGPLSQEQVDMAYRYAYSFVIRRQLPFSAVSGNGARLEITSLDDLKPGRDASLDLICDRIMHGGEFILEEPSDQPVR